MYSILGEARFTPLCFPPSVRRSVPRSCNMAANPVFSHYVDGPPKARHVAARRRAQQLLPELANRFNMSLKRTKEFIDAYHELHYGMLRDYGHMTMAGWLKFRVKQVAEKPERDGKLYGRTVRFKAKPSVKKVRIKAEKKVRDIVR